MKKTNIILASVTAMTVLLASGVMAFAATGTAADTTPEPPSGIGRGPAVMSGMTDDQRDAVHQARFDSMTNAVNDLVKKGTLTQEEADQMLQRPSATPLNPPERYCSNLTDDQMTALHDATKVELQIQLTKLVENGTITQDQADQFLVSEDFRGGGPGMGRHMGSGMGRHMGAGTQMESGGRYCINN